MKKNTKLILGALAAYLVMLVLLVVAETSSADASITNFWDAVWFSLITMTTVGYGDMSPVTLGGRIIGVIFALFSLGVFSALIGIGISLLNGQLRPGLRLGREKNRQWFAFSEENADSAALAEKLAAEREDCVIIFPAGEGKAAVEGRTVRTGFDSDKLVKLHGGKAEGLSVFLMKTDGRANYFESLEYTAKDIDTYCMTDITADSTPDTLHVFSRTECLSRCYWKNHPLRQGEGRVVLIGCGTAGAELLEQALLTNVFEPGRSTEYFVFEDSAGFAFTHHRLADELAEKREGEDRLHFMEKGWKECPDILADADRIIICHDDDSLNVETFDELKTWFPVRAEIHVRLEERLPEIPAFGTREEIITPEFVMKDALNRRAIMINELYNKDSGRPTQWNELSHFVKQSNIAAADHLIVKARWLLNDDSITELTDETLNAAYSEYKRIYPEKAELTEEIEHRRWSRFHLMYNWTGGDTRNNAARVHPMMRPFSALSEPERKKDDYAWEILGRMKE